MNEENLNTETYNEDIESKIQAHKNIERLDEARELYEEIKNRNYTIVEKLSKTILEIAYEKARLGLKDMLNNRYSNEMTESYIREYKRAITNAQKAVCPELFMDASQLLKRQQTDNNS